MKRSYAVFGLGEFGRSISRELFKMGADVLACDVNEIRTAAIADEVTTALVFNALDENAYKEIGLSYMDAVIVAMTGSLDASILAIMAAKDAGVPSVIAKAADDLQKNIFEKVGATKIVLPERDGGIRLARNILAGNFLDYIELSDKIRLVESKVQQEWVGKTLKDLNLRGKYNLNVIAINRDNDMITSINPNLVFCENDTVLVITDSRHLHEI